MPVVDIKGVGKAQFPDEMPIEDIRKSKSIAVIRDDQTEYDRQLQLTALYNLLSFASTVKLTILIYT